MISRIYYCILGLILSLRNTEGQGAGPPISKVRKFERSKSNTGEFEYKPLNTGVETPYNEFPNASSFKWDIDSQDMLFGNGCDVQLDIELIDFAKLPDDATVTLCLFKGKEDADQVFFSDMHLNILGKSYDPVTYYKELLPITGFVMGEIHSLVQGFLIENNFYGTVRIFDPLPSHHIVFYIEPFENLGHYHSGLKAIAKPNGRNAAIFEFIRHEDDRSTSGNAGAPTPNNPNKAQEEFLTVKSDIVYQRIHVHGQTTSTIFDVSSRNQSFICEVCVYVQPNFAKVFGFGKGISYGIGEIISLLKNVQFVFQGIDFNGDLFSEEINLVVREFLVSDLIDPSKEPGPIEAPVPDYSKKKYRNHNAANGGQGVKRRRKRAANSKEQVEENYNEEIKQLDGMETYKSMKKQLNHHLAKTHCCVTLAYIYHNLAPKFSLSVLAGACSRRNNLGLISGNLHMHKLGKFDLFRATMHALGHLFGAIPDDVTNPLCKRDMMATPNIFNNILMDPIQATDIGTRPNSMRFSPCAKAWITRFLASPMASCLRPIENTENKTVCGNGIVEGDEECDCGSIWQCHTEERRTPPCCGESDGLLGCKRIGTRLFQKLNHCHRPWVW